jgi:serine/threonine-protein kinase
MSFGQVGRHHFLTMELASRSLARELRFAAGGKPWHERLADAVAIVSGLGAVHAAGIVHRDLTPQNILRFSQGRLAIADFGLAVDQPGNSTAVAGTPNYIAPEILQGERPSFASDIWQLGVILHEMLFDCRPGQAAAAAPASPADALRDLCARCVDSVPANRPADVNAIARALGAAAATRAS